MSSDKYGKSNPVLTLEGTGGITITRSGHNQQKVTIDGAAAGGTSVHGNERHEPPFSDVYHTHTGSDGSSQVNHADLINVLPDQHFTLIFGEPWAWDGIVSTHDIAHTPVSGWGIGLYLDGRRLMLTTDYTISGTTIQMKDGAGSNWIPPAGSVSACDYAY